MDCGCQHKLAAHLIGLVPAVAAVGLTEQQDKTEQPYKAAVLMDLCTAAVAVILAGLAAILSGAVAVAAVTTTPELLRVAHRRLVEMAALVDHQATERQERSHLAAVAAPAQALPPALAALAKSSLLSSLHKDLNNDNLCCNRNCN
jgi:hypothetical protein